jgi:hypothetical protein
MKSKDYYKGFTDALCFISEIFESRSNALYRIGLRRKDIRMIVAICDAAICVRSRMAEIGPRKFDLVLKKDGSAEFVERKNGKT